MLSCFHTATWSAIRWRILGITHQKQFSFLMHMYLDITCSMSTFPGFSYKRGV